MIDLASEEVLTLTAATRLPELRRNGRSPHLTTMVRWSFHGCRGIRLETARQGGRRVTSREAVARFLNQLNGTAVVTSDPSAGHLRAEAALDIARI